MSIVDELPSQWVWTKLSELAPPVKVQINPRAKTVYNYLSIENIESNTGRLVGFIPTDGTKIKSSKLSFQKGDVLYSKLRPNLNKVLEAPFDGISATDLVPLRPNSLILPGYLARFLRSRSTVSHLSHRVHGIQMPRVSISEIEQLDVPLPPMPEQHRIVAKLEAASAISRSTGDRITAVSNAVRKLRSSLLAEIFRRASANQGSVLARLGDVCTLITKGESPKWQGFDYVDKGVPFVRSENVLRGELDWKTAVKIPEAFHEKLLRSQLQPGDALVNLVGASIGRAAIVPKELVRANINQAVGLIRPGPRISSAFLLLLLLSPPVQRHFHAEKVETARANLSLRDLRDLTVPLPDSPGQAELVAYASRNLELVSRLELSVARCQRKIENVEAAFTEAAIHGTLVEHDPREGSAAELLEGKRRTAFGSNGPDSQGHLPHPPLARSRP